MMISHTVPGMIRVVIKSGLKKSVAFVGHKSMMMICLEATDAAVPNECEIF